MKRSVNILKYWYKTQCRSKRAKATWETSFCFLWQKGLLGPGLRLDLPDICHRHVCRENVKKFQISVCGDTWYFCHLSIATVFTENNHDGWIHSFCRLDTCPFFFCCSHLHTGWLPGEIFKFYSGLIAMQCNVPRIFESHKCCVWLSPYVNIVTFVHCSLSEQPRAGYKLHVTI